MEGPSDDFLLGLNLQPYPSPFLYEANELTTTPRGLTRYSASGLFIPHSVAERHQDILGLVWLVQL